ncbi:MAG: hypothetical protein AAGL17_24340, partial [Cyanobacteria bacterium J06576_12]
MPRPRLRTTNLVLEDTWREGRSQLAKSLGGIGVSGKAFCNFNVICFARAQTTHRCAVPLSLDLRGKSRALIDCAFRV